MGLFKDNCLKTSMLILLFFPTKCNRQREIQERGGITSYMQLASVCNTLQCMLYARCFIGFTHTAQQWSQYPSLPTICKQLEPMKEKWLGLVTSGATKAPQEQGTAPVVLHYNSFCQVAPTALLDVACVAPVMGRQLCTEHIRLWSVS